MFETMEAHIQTYLEQDIYPMHMPGHKRNGAFFPDDLHRLDMTEFGDMDNLHQPEGIIDDAQKRMAMRYGADWTCLLVNGATAGIAAAVAAACPENGCVLVDRNSHRSVYTGLVWSGARPVYVWPELTDFGLSGGICPEHVEALLAEKKNMKAVVVTSPTYEGFVSDIKEISKIAHRHDAVLIVDEAHGAHFPFHSSFPPSALSMGADISVNSLHKTLPLLSQCAVLHGKGGRLDKKRVQMYLSLFQTSSPSYLLMSLMDRNVALLQKEKQYFDVYVERLSAFRAAFCGGNGALRPLDLIGGHVVGQWGIAALDTGKLAFVVQAKMEGPEIEKRLADEYRVQIEYSGRNHILAMTSVADTPDGFERLGRGIKALNASLTYEPNGFAEAWDAPIAPEIALTPREAFMSEPQTVSLTEAVGRVSAGFIVPYPPGVPVVVPGERLTKEIVNQINRKAASGIKVMGIENHTCTVLKPY